MTYRETLTALREINAAMGNADVQADAQHYDQLAGRQIELMDQAVALLAQSLMDDAARMSRFPLAPETAHDLARGALRRQSLYW